MDLSTAAILVSPIIIFLITQVSTYCNDQIVFFWNVKGELEKLAQKLNLIEVVLQDAENRQVERNRLVKNWLGGLQDVAHDVEDVLDELQCKLLRLKMKNRIYAIGYKIAQKIIAVNVKLDGITKDMERFNFVSQSDSTSGSNRTETSSEINDSAAVVGRENDVSNILGLLNQEDYSVVRITGMGGIGKTTLAQLVYAIADNSNSLTEPFEIKMWVSVSRKSKNKEIFCDLLPNCDCQSSLNDIVDRLKQRFMEGKCLIVLDDVWNNGIDLEKLLKDLLSMIYQGSKILMTMRSAEPIPPMTGCRYNNYTIKGLSKDDCWSIIATIAFAHGGAEETENLIKTGKQIATKCGGLPLAAKTFGRLLYFRKNDAAQWLSILNSEIGKLPKEENKILSILRLSYDPLSAHVKRCFSYCSIFPKGHKFLKNELIRMWMAEGFLDSPWSASPETIGEKYFKILLENFFFHDEVKNRWGDTKSCRMNDLVHDLAISVAGSESRMVKVRHRTPNSPKGAKVIEQSAKIRRLGLQFDYIGSASAIPSHIFQASEKLRTLVSSGIGYLGFYNDDAVLANQIFSLSLLRILNLSRTGIKKLPESICNLKLLKYLDLSCNRIETFPKSFSQLYNMQTLRLKRCDVLRELPEDMRKLIGLEYLIFSGRGINQLTQMPREVSRFSKLKKLSAFVVGIGDGYGIEELKHLNHLGGELVIKKLGSVTDANQANLKDKEKIKHLQLHWDEQSCDTSDTYRDNLVINGLRPHENLRRLNISNFGGSEFPTWMSTSIRLPNLVDITLIGCLNCQQLPSLGRLQSLKSLVLERMDAIKQIGDAFYQSNEESPFPSLVELRLCSLFNLEEWLEDQRSTSASSFPCLETLEIIGCKKLFTTPRRFPSLQKLDFAIKLSESSVESLPLKLLRGVSNVLQTLVVSDCNEFVGFLPDYDEEQQYHQPEDPCNSFLSKIEILSCPCLTVLPADFRGLNSLTYLAIKGCKSLRLLPDGIQYLPALQTLIIGGFSEELETVPFPAATGLDGEQYFISLRELTICGWNNLKELPDQLQLLTSLHRLNISDFPCLSGLPEWFGKLSSLQILDIENCRSLKYLPSEEQMLRLTSLQILNIRYSPLLLGRCRSPHEEWDKIARLNQVNRPSVLDHMTRDAKMNVELVARTRSGVFSNQFKEKCWTDSCGNNCLMLFPKSFQITWEDNPNHWTWRSMIEPSKSDDDVEIEVPELVEVRWLHVQGKVEISRLSPGVNYEVVFIVMFQSRSYGWNTPVDLCLELPGGERLVQKVNLETMPKLQWIEIHIGDFKTPQRLGDPETKINFTLFQHEAPNWKKGLVIEGAIVRPKK